eukprot:g21257.t1
MALAGSVGQLVSMGWRRETLAFFHAMPIDEIQEMLPLATKDWVEEDYNVLLREAKRQRRWMGVEDNLFYPHQRLLYKDASVIDARIAELPTAVAEAGTTLALARKALPRVTWKTRLQKALAGAAGEQQRAKVEEAERERWIKELLKLLGDAGFLGSTAKSPEAMRHLEARCAMGRRASTIRQHVKYGRKLQIYMESVYGVAWLRGYMDFIGYVALLTELYSTRKNEEGSLYRIMIPESTSYWSEHSERVTIMSWALIAEIPRETRRRWGRWSPGVDEEYAVTTKRVVTAAQGNLASKIRAQYGITDFVDDKSVLNGFSLWLQTVYFKTVSESHQETMKIAPPMWGGLDAAPVQVVKKPLREPKQEEDDLVVLDSPTEVFSDDEGMDDVQPGDRPADAIRFASLYLTWQSSVKRTSALDEMDAEAVTHKAPKTVPGVEMQLYRSEYEKKFYKLKDSECPGKPSFEDLCEQIDGGEFRAMALRHFGSRAEEDDAETGSLQVGKAGQVRIKKSRVETNNPTNMEEFRAKINLVVNHLIFARFRYPHKQTLEGISPFTAIEYLNYICSKNVAQLESVTIDDIPLHRPSLKLILAYEYQMRKEVVDEVLGEVFRVDAMADQTGIAIGGWETAETSDTKKARWFHVRLDRKNAAYLYLKGEPFRTISTSELLAVTVAIVIFGQDSKWRSGAGRVSVTGLTDNVSNAYLLDRFLTTKFPASLVLMELACQLEKYKLDLSLSWIPREQNEPADDLSKGRFELFEEANRVEVEMENLPFIVLYKLMDTAIELDEEIKVKKVSKGSTPDFGKTPPTERLRLTQPW